MEKLPGDPKIAIIHDWLVTYGGAEKALIQIIECFPTADIFCTVEYLPVKIRKLYPQKIHTTFIQNLPFSNKFYWYYSPLMPIAIEQIDLSVYDLIISSSHAFAKGVITYPNQLHISYVHSSPRFIWDLQFDYFKNFSFDKGLKRMIASYLFFKMRNWDNRSTNGIDVLIANSKFIQRRILKCYRRNSDLIYPGVDTNFFVPTENPKCEYYLAGSFMNPFKKLDLIVETFTSKFPEKKLLVFGVGPQEKQLKKIAGKNITFVGKVTDEKLNELYQNCIAYIFAATEDFGLVMVEAQSSGAPVIAYKKGGASEIVCIEEANPTGVLFEEPSIDSLASAVNYFENIKSTIKRENCRKNALRFCKNQFKTLFFNKIKDEWETWGKYIDAPDTNK